MKAAFIGVAAVAGVAAALIWHRPDAPVELSEGVYITPSRELPALDLIDHRGQPFTTADFRGHWSMLFFGYTNCPDFCPTTLTTLAAMEKRLRAAGAAVRPRVVFMSVDPRRDTPAQLARYVPYFDPEFLGVTARDQAAVQAVAQRLGVNVTIHEEHDGSYTVDHSGAIFVIDPNARVAAILTGPYSAAALVGDFQHLVAAARS